MNRINKKVFLSTVLVFSLGVFTAIPALAMPAGEATRTSWAGFTFDTYPLPTVEIWHGPSDSPKPLKDELTLAEFRAFEECNITTGECITTNFREMQWVQAPIASSGGDPVFLAYDFITSTSDYNFSSLTVGWAINYLDEYEVMTVTPYVEIRGYIPHYDGDTTLSFILKTNKNANSVFLVNERGAFAFAPGSGCIIAYHDQSHGKKIVITIKDTRVIHEDGFEENYCLKGEIDRLIMFPGTAGRRVEIGSSIFSFPPE